MSCPKCGGPQETNGDFRVCANDHAYKAEGRSLQAVEKAIKSQAPKKDPLADLIQELCLFGLPLPEREIVFHPERKWRWDAAWDKAMVKSNDLGFAFREIELKIAVEYNGIHGANNVGHASIAMLMRDYEKAIEGQLLGWLVLPVTAESVRTGQAREFILRAFSLRGWKL